MQLITESCHIRLLSNVTLVNSDIQLIFNQLKIDFVIHAADGVITEALIISKE